MKNILLTLVLAFTLTSFQNQAHAQDKGGMNPKAKAFLIVTGYGTALGTLLGIASLAFDAKPRAIAQGASLGLYAGIIFGTYIIASHEMKKNQEPGNLLGDPNSSYRDAITPYNERNIPPPDSPYSEDAGGGFFDSPGGFRSGGPHAEFSQFKTKSSSNSVPIYFELVRLQF